MGMFDRVWVSCPQCGAANEFQSKSGDCTLADYTLADAPPSILGDLDRQGAISCEKCGVPFEIKVRCIAIPVPVGGIQSFD